MHSSIFSTGEEIPKAFQTGEKMKKEDIGKNYFVYTNEDHSFTTDAVVLAYFSAVKKSEKLCDFGTGCGIIPIIFLRDELTKEKISAVEIQSEACDLFEKTVKENHLEDKVEIFNHDLKNIREIFPASSFDLVTMNPPYFEIDSGKQSDTQARKIARCEICCDIFSAAKSASDILKYSGRFVVCHRSERLCDVLEAMRKNSIEPKRLRFVMNYPESAPYLVLVEGRKGGKNKLLTEPPLILYNSDKTPSEEYLKIYSSFFEKDA